MTVPHTFQVRMLQICSGQLNLPAHGWTSKTDKWHACVEDQNYLGRGTRQSVIGNGVEIVSYSELSMLSFKELFINIFMI